MFVRRCWISGLAATLLLTMSFMAAVTCALADETPKGRKLALLVGVRQYDHAQLTNLQFAENDVEELGDLLRKHNFQVVVLTTGRGQQDGKLLPTAANVRVELAKLLKDVNKHDLALVGLAGHGIQPLGSDKAYFCPKDGNPTIRNGVEKEPSTVAFPDKLVGLDDLLATLDDSGVGQKLLLVDACRNDPGVRGRRGVDRVKVSALPAETGVLLSCSNGQYAFEHKSWGKGGHGAFFAAVLDGLRGGAAERSNVVTWESLGLYVRRRVPTMVEQVYGKDGGEQRPNLIANISAAPAVLTSLRVATPVSPPLAIAPFNTVQAKQHQQAWHKYLKLPYENKNSIGMDLRLIPPGEFQMGSDEDPEDLLSQHPKWLNDRDNVRIQSYWLKDERAHTVRITRPFYLGKHEVTKGEFRKFVEATGHRTEVEIDGKVTMAWNESKKHFSSEPGNHWKNWGVNQSDDSPVVQVSWNDAQKFCAWLSKTENQTYRLPTEAEWEYACRAGTTTRFYNGDSFEESTAVGNVADASWKEKFTHLNAAKVTERKDGYPFTAPRGQFAPNSWGLYDMHGNVREWCWDRYSENYYTISPTNNPAGPLTGSERVLRGGSWWHRPVNCRAASRNGNLPSYSSSSLGFRVVAVIKQP